MPLIRACDSRVLVIICKMPHGMNCSNNIPENNKKVICWSACHKGSYAKEQRAIPDSVKTMTNRERRDSQTRRKRWYEINKERLISSQRAYCQQNEEHIRNCRRQYGKSNREWLNEYWRSHYAKNMDRIRQRLNGQESHAFEGLGPKA